MNPAQDSNTTESKFITQKLSLSDAAELIGISHTSLRRYETLGKIKAERLENGYRLFDIEDAKNFKKQLEVEREEYRRRLAEESHKNREQISQIKPVFEKLGVNPAKKSFSKAKVLASAILGVLVFFAATIGTQNSKFAQETLKKYVKTADNFAKTILLANTAASNYKEMDSNVLGASDRNANWVFSINVPATFKNNVIAEQDLTVLGNFSTTQLASLNGGLTTSSITFNDGATINNLGAIDETTRVTLQEALNITTTITDLNGEPLGDTVTDEGNILMAVGGEWVSTPQTEITSLGAIGAGSWEADVIAANYGGTGMTSYVVGDLIYATAPSTLAAISIGPSGYLMTSNGTTPSWQPVGAVFSVTTGVTAGNGLVGGGTSGVLSLGVGAGNGISVNADDITIDATTAGTTSVTAANSGLEVTADGLRLLGGCSNGQSLMWDSTMQMWKCSVVFPTGTGGTNQITFWVDSQTLSGSDNFFWDNSLARLGIGTTSALAALDIRGAIRLGANANGGNILNTTVGSSAPSGDLFWGNRTLTDSNNVSTYATTGVTAGSGLTGGGTIGGLTLNIGAGNGITINADDITIDTTTTATTSTTASNSGLEVTASGLKLIGGCADGEVLAWDATLTVWKCATSGAASVAGTGSIGQVSFWTGTSVLSGSDNFYWNNGTGSLGLGTTAPTSMLTIAPTSAAGIQLNPFGASAGQTTELRFLELSANGSNYTGFKSPDNLDNNIVYTLPSSTGPADYILTIQNDMTLQWKQVSGIGGVGDISSVGSTTSGAAFSDSTADDQWFGLGSAAGRIEFDDQTTDEINLLAAHVGVGTTSPTQLLDVNGAIRLGTIGLNNILNTNAAGGSPSGNIFWGNRTIIDSINIASLNISTLTSANAGLTLSGATGPVTITLDVTTTGLSSTTASNSGLEIDSDGLRLLGGCVDNELLKWDSAMQVWKCGTAGVGTITGTGSIGQAAFWSGSSSLSGTDNFFWDNISSYLGIGTTAPLQTLDVNGAIRLGTNTNGGNVLNTTVGSSAPSGDLFWGTRVLTDSTNISSYATTGVTAGSGLTGGGTVGVISLDIGAGNGVTVNANDITIDSNTSGTSSTTASNSGLEVTADGLRLLGGCADTQTLAWDAGSQVWKCVPTTGGTLTGNGVATRLTFWSSSGSLASNQALYWDNTNLRLGIGTSSPTYSVDVAGVTRAYDIITQELILGASNASIAKSYGGFDGHTNFSGGIGTGGKDSLNAAQRLTAQGNLVNIGSIQAGDTTLTSGGNFGVAVTYPSMGAGPWGIALADVNGDGKADILSVNNTAADGASVAVRMNNGSGTFGTATTYPTLGTSPKGIGVIDLNGDGKLDLVTSNNATTATITVRMNNGSGVFGTATTYPTNGAGAYGIGLGDINGDGKPDVAVANDTSTSVSVLLNNGGGTLGTPTTYPSLGGVAGPFTVVAIADINGDGKPDMTTTNATSNSVATFINSGNGTFGTATTYPTLGNASLSMAMTDFSGDGKLDVAVSNFNTGSISILTNSGTGTFGTAVTYPTNGVSPQYIAAADFNGDGKPDLVTPHGTTNSIGVLMNNGNGTFGASTTYPGLGTAPLGVAVGDINGDGKNDIVTTNTTQNSITVYTNQTSTMFNASSASGNLGIGVTASGSKLSIAGGAVIGSSSYIFGRTAPSNGLQIEGRVGIGTSSPTYQLDVTGVARFTDVITQELIIAASNANIMSGFVGYDAYTNFTGGIGTGGKDGLLATQRLTTSGNLVNIGSIQAGEITLTSGGTLGAATTYPATGSADTRAISAGDVNGDGKADLVFVNGTSNSVGVLINTGTGTFGAATTYPSNGLGAGGIVIADMNGDGKADLALTNDTTNAIGIMINNGSGTFSAAATYPASGITPRVIVAGDINGDGKNDVAAANVSNNTITVLLNSGSGTLGTAVTYPANGLNPRALVLSDVNGDGKADISFINSGSSSIGVMLNSGTGTFGAAATYPTRGVSASGGHITTGDLSGDGKADLAYINESTSNSVGVLINSGTGTFGGATTYPSAGVSARAIVIADMNGDGKADLALTNANTSNSVGIMINTGSGTFGAASTYPANGTSPNYITAADFNGDGKNDVATINTSSGSVSVLLNQTSTMFNANAATGNLGIGITASSTKLSVAGGAIIGSNGFIFGRTAPSNGVQIEGRLGVGSASPLSTVDINGNMTIGVGFAGIFTAPTNGLLVLGRVGLGTTAPMYQLDIAGVTRSYNVITHELIIGASNASILGSYEGYEGFTNFTGGIGTGGKDSLLSTQRITTQGNLVNIASIQAGETTLTSGGTFGAASTYPAGDAYYNTIADLNGDGKLDVAYTGFSNNSYGTVMNSGTGTFGAFTTYPARGSGPSGIAATDVNGDGKTDILYTNATTNSIGVAINSGTGTFAGATTYPSYGVAPRSIAAGDINGDGKADLVFANQSSNSVGTMINNGNGTFGTATTYPALGVDQYSVAIADYNGDGRADVAFTNLTSNTVGIMLNAGNGILGTATIYSSGITSPFYISSVDVNADGKTDLAFATNVNSVGIMLNTGNGAFGAATTYPSRGVTTRGLTATDFTGDGKPDLAYVNNSSNTVGTMVNNGNGTFAAATTYPSAGVGPLTVAAGDLNGDGKPELVYTNSAPSNSIGVLLNTISTLFNVNTSTNNLGIGITASSSKLSIAGGTIIGSAGFIFGQTAPTNGLRIEGRLGVGGSLGPLSTADISGNMVIGSSYAGTVTSPNNSLAIEGRLSLGTTFSTNKLNIAGNAIIGSNNFLYSGVTAPSNGLQIEGRVGIGAASPSYMLDVTGAARFTDVLTQELIIGASNANLLSAYTGYQAFTNFSGGIGTGGKDTLLATQRLTSSGNLVNIGSIQAGEALFTNGGTFGTAVTYPSNGAASFGLTNNDFNGDGFADVALANNTGDSISVLMGNGNGTFGTAATYPTLGDNPREIASGDLNGDGRADLLVTNVLTDSVSVFINNGSGTFGGATTYPSLGNEPYGPTIGDVNSDGKADLLYTNHTDGVIGILINTGNGTFGAATTFPSKGLGARDTALADLNGDSKQDIVFLNELTDSFGFALGNGNGTFGTATTYPAMGTDPTSMAVTDFNGDGRVDISFVNNSVSSFAVALNSGNGIFATAATYPTAGLAPYGVKAGDLNGDGKADVAIANSVGSSSVAVLINSGTGTFGAATTYPAMGTGKDVAIVDLNGDGRNDIAIDNPASVGVLLNQTGTILYAKASTGYVGIGTTTPGQFLDVLSPLPGNTIRALNSATLGASSGGAIWAAVNQTPSAVDQRLGGNFFGGITTGTTYVAGAGIEAFSNSAWSGSNAETYLKFGVTPNGSTTRTEAMRIDSEGQLGIGTTNPTIRLQVSGNDPNYIASFNNVGNATNRWGIGIQSGTNDASGTNIAADFYDGDGTLQGQITFTSGTVTYGAFTANHDTSIPEEFDEEGYPYGTLLCIVSAGANPDPSSERNIKYDSKACDSGPYADNVLGAYAGKYSNKENTHQVYVLGDGQILVNGEGGDIKVGDPIVTSSTEGIGMKANKSGTSIGYAQEDYHFDSESEVKLIAVQYGLGKYVDSEETDKIQNDLSFIKQILGIDEEGSTESSSSQDFISNIQMLISDATDQLSNLMESLGLSNDNGTLTVSADMNVLGDTTLSNVTVTGDFLAGQFKIDSIDNSLDINGPSCYNNDTQIKNTLLCEAQTMYIQKGLSGNVNLFDGNVVIEPDGNLTVTGTVKANKVSADEFEVTGQDHKLIGTSVLGAGTTRVTVGTSGVKANSKIFVTPTSFTGEKPLIVTQKTEGQNFEVSIESPYTTDISFDWWIVNVASSN